MRIDALIMVLLNLMFMFTFFNLLDAYFLTEGTVNILQAFFNYVVAAIFGALLFLISVSYFTNWYKRPMWFRRNFKLYMFFSFIYVVVLFASVLNPSKWLGLTGGHFVSIALTIAVGQLVNLNYYIFRR